MTLVLGLPLASLLDGVLGVFGGGETDAGEKRHHDHEKDEELHVD